ncbi:dienelactone hydrolase [Talaromyces proteolyticus]|uniref:Dienelactone hydrolase n=1 Tax=Talaromyces proteolyticus TaxID=1131652 RepID=A0AAD4KUM1_9EURO|nr:dienelactone hydrolase [Talaromyces proteolyticus]KAH8698724.1 dienelactone hydrolase [Talaromyces proteolyticus]
MASHHPAQCCTVGVTHGGVANGQSVKVEGKHDAYLATPSAGVARKNAAILYIPDILGIWINSKLMADQFAANGYTTLVIDIFNGDALELNRPADFNLMGWMTQGRNGKGPHTPKEVDSIIEDALEYIKRNLGFSNIGAVGYCFGAKYVVRHYKNGIKVGYVAHPSFVEKDELAAITGPLSISAAQTDPIFPTEKRHESEKILNENGNPYQIHLYSGVSHGFAVRCDPSIKTEKFAREQAFLQSIAWFDNWLI